MSKTKTFKDRDTLERLYADEGLTQAEIGEQFDVTSENIGYWMAKFNIEARQGKRPEWLTDGELYRLYWERGWSQSAIGEFVGVDTTTVALWMNKGDIETR